MKKQRKFVKVQRVVYEISQARNIDVYVWRFQYDLMAGK
jgi:hypothetical protein